MTPTPLRGLLVAASITVLATACTREPVAASGVAAPADSAVIFSEVGPFDLVSQAGARVSRESLLGRPWVASFLFTRCTGPCPMVRSTLKKVERRLEGSEARIVTFSVDPSWDTPEVLRAYAEAIQADPKRWLFLTGEKAGIYDLLTKSFFSAAEQAPVGQAPVGEQVSHSTRLVAVDKKGRVRGFYHGESDDQIDLLVARLAFLQREPE